MTKKEPFLTKRIKSIGFAFKGAMLLIKTESSIKVQFALAILLTFLGFFFNISSTEWIMQTFAIGLVMSVEGLNTGIEKIADFIHPDHHSRIGFIKDIAAGAVFLAATSAIIVGLIIYIPKFL